MTSVSTVFTRVQQSESARYRRNKWISRVAPVEEDAEVRDLGGTSKRKKQTMKKLMIAAAVAAMIGGAQAVTSVTTKGHWEKDDCGDKTYVCGETGCGTAHKVTISLKTTDAKNQKAKSDCEECTQYRVQKTKKITGLIWQQLGDGECECFVPFGNNVAFWTEDDAFPAEFIVALSKIGKGENSKSIEAVGSITDGDQVNLTWAGFGSVVSTLKKGKENPCGEPEQDYCVEYVKSITGGIAGTLPAPEVGKCDDDCAPLAYATCCDDEYSDMTEYTAAYGTIKITYDAATAKKVAVAQDDTDIGSFFKLPNSLKKQIEKGDVVLDPEEVTIEE